MRTGLVVSISAHVLLLVLGLINLGLTEPLQPNVQSIAVDLVPIEEFSNIRLGQLDSEVVETEYVHVGVVGGGGSVVPPDALRKAAIVPAFAFSVRALSWPSVPVGRRL